MTRLSLVQGKQSTLLLLHHLINTVHTLTGDTAIPSSGKTVDQLLHHLINTVHTLTGDTAILVQGKQWTLLLLHHLINTVHTLTGDTAIPSSGKTVDSPTSTSLN